MSQYMLERTTKGEKMMKRLIAGILIALLYTADWVYIIISGSWFISWLSLKVLIHSLRLYITIPEVVIIYLAAILLIVFGIKEINKKNKEKNK